MTLGELLLLILGVWLAVKFIKVFFNPWVWLVVIGIAYLLSKS